MIANYIQLRDGVTVRELFETVSGWAQKDARGNEILVSVTIDDNGKLIILRAVEQWLRGESVCLK